MDRPLLALLGLGLIVVVVVDVVWTTLAVAAGRGPLTDRIAKTIWRSVRGLSNHRLLQGAGYAIPDRPAAHLGHRGLGGAGPPVQRRSAE